MHIAHNCTISSSTMSASSAMSAVNSAEESQETLAPESVVAIARHAQKPLLSILPIESIQNPRLHIIPQALRGI